MIESTFRGRLTAAATFGRCVMRVAVAAALVAASSAAAEDARRPNIVVIWGDDVGFTNLSVYSRGVMGYRTPNIDRIGKEGAISTDNAFVYGIRANATF